MRELPSECRKGGGRGEVAVRGARWVCGRGAQVIGSAPLSRSAFHSGPDEASNGACGAMDETNGLLS